MTPSTEAWSWPVAFQLHTVPSEARIAVRPRPATRLRKPGKPFLATGVIAGVPSPHVQTVPSELRATLWVPPAVTPRTAVRSGAAAARRARLNAAPVKLLVMEPLGVTLELHLLRGEKG